MPLLVGFHIGSLAREDALTLFMALQQRVGRETISTVMTNLGPPPEENIMDIMDIWKKEIQEEAREEEREKVRRE